MKKVLLSLGLMALFVSSCELPSSLISSSTSSQESSSSKSDYSSSSSSKSSSSSSVDEKDKPNVIINVVDDNVETLTSVEEAVNKVFDSVVVINVALPGGYGAGSGVIIGESETETYIVTCHHVIEDSTSIEVTTSANESYSATLVGGDPDSDIAVVKINKTGFKAVSFLKDSNSLRPGQTAIVIGNALGILSNTVTVGVVSAVKREITGSDGEVRELIQTDAAINNGNSGGGMFNADGELIGIVNSGYASSTIEGLNFAVPCDTALAVCNDLIEKGYVTGRYKLGITITDGYTYSSGRIFGGGNYIEVTYISDVDERGCCYGYLTKNQILVSLSVDYEDIGKESVSLNQISSASDANKFISSANLSIGDVLTFGVKNSYSSASVDYVDVPIVQFIYS